MQIGSIASGALSLLNLLGKPATGAGAVASGFESAASFNSANSAQGGGQALPASSTGGLSFETMLALQSIGENREKHEAGLYVQEPQRDDGTQAFLNEAQKSPMERMREDVLKALGLTEDDLNNMTTDERQAAEEKISQLVQEKLKAGQNGGDAAAQNQGVGQFLVKVA
jgi:hypothetical protein